MRILLLAATLAATATLAVTTPVFADTDPSMHQIYQAAETGHLDQAQTMMNQVLTDHPKSGTAHYVQAELYAKEGKTSLARSELAVAEQLDPGLPRVNPQSLQRLRAALGLATRTSGLAPVRAAPGAGIPWGIVLVFAAAIGILLMVFRRRSYPQYPVAGGPAAAGTPGAYGPGGYGPAPMGGGGIGSGIAGGLASGLAVGAGLVAGEELAHHFLDGGRQGGGVIPPAEAGESGVNNGDMGGSDFGVNDPGSWDDGGSGGGGGDWS